MRLGGSWVGGRGRFSCNTRTTRFQGRCHHQRHCHRHHHYHDIAITIIILVVFNIIITIIFIFVRLSIVQGKCEMDKCSILITITVVDINHWCCWNHPLYSMIDFPLPLCAILTRLQLLLRRWFKILFERRYFATFFLLWIFDIKKMMEILPLKFTVTELKTTHSEKMYFSIAHLTCAVHTPIFKYHK